MVPLSLLVLLSALASSSLANEPTPTPAPGVHAAPASQSSQFQPISVPLRRRHSQLHELQRRAELSDIDLLESLKAGRDALIDKFVDSRGDAAKRRLHQKRAERDARHRRRAALEGQLQKRDPKLIPMTNHNFDTTYSGTISLGTPATQFDVILDTGSSDTWVPNTNCTCTTSNCNSCAQGPAWDPSSSSTFSHRGKVLSIMYGSGQVSGATGSDVVELGGYTINDQVIGIVESAARVLPGDVSGLMGFAFNSISKSGGIPWWLRVFSGDANNSGGTPDQKMLSFWLSRYIDAATAISDNPGGQVTFGGTNSSLYTGDINYIGIDQPAKWWVIPVENVGVDGQTVSVDDGAQKAIIDTGTTLVGGEDAVLASIYGSIPGAIEGGTLASQLEGFYVLPCNATPSVSLTFGGNSYPYSSADLLYMPIPQILDGHCVSSLFTYSSKDPHSIDYVPNGMPYWLVGDAFLKNVYSVFNLGDGGNQDGSGASVGFATLSGTDGQVGMSGGNDTPTNASGNVSSGSNGTVSAGPHTQSGIDPLSIGVGPDVDTTVVVVVTATDDGTPTPTGSGSSLQVGLASSWLSAALLCSVGVVLGW